MAVAGVVAGLLSERAIQARQVRRRRLGALILDFLFFSIVLTVVNNVYGVTVVTSGEPLSPGRMFDYYTTTTAVAWPALTLLWLVYYIFPETLFGASLGKLLCGLCVVRVDGHPLGIGAVFARNVLRLVDVLPGFYLIGGLSVLFTTNSQRVGDRWAGTTVAARDEAVAWDPHATRRPPPGARRVLGCFVFAALLFTVAFDYFGRPPLVIEGMYNQHQLLMSDVTSYRLGDAQWAFGRVTYPITALEGTKSCAGSITLDWFGLGWTESQAQWTCSS
jgi:uncharacterized RDD family membrane protein YckC